jgi:phage shock protein B
MMALHMSGVLGFVLGLVFLTVVAPIWIIAHYLARWRRSRKLSADDEKSLGEVYEIARRMEARVAALERVLDAEAPGWRTRTGG